MGTPQSCAHFFQDGVWEQVEDGVDGGRLLHGAPEEAHRQVALQCEQLAHAPAVWKRGGGDAQLGGAGLTSNSLSPPFPLPPRSEKGMLAGV